MDRPFGIAVAQPRCTAYDVGANATAHAEAIRAAGARVAYGKVCLHGSESGRFVPGEPAALEVDGRRLGLAVCRDTGIAEHAARTAALGIDGYVAGILHHDHEGGLAGERARRIAAAHGVWVAMAAFSGPTGGGFGATSGRSGIWSAAGELLAEAGTQAGDLARAVLPAQEFGRTSPRS